MLTDKELKARVFECTDVKAEYDRLDEEFQFLDKFLKTRAVEAVEALQHYSTDHGMDRITMADINSEIKAVRKKRTARDTL
jgi:hypothetical protein